LAATAAQSQGGSGRRDHQDAVKIGCQGVWGLSRSLVGRLDQRSHRGMEDFVFILLTLVVFAVLGLVAWGVERL
jgi:hypothetical protein